MCAIVCGVWLFAFVCFQNCFNEFDFADLTLSCVSSKQFGSFSFATMCGLVVPIALAHAGCILALISLRLRKHLHGAACPGDEPTKRQDIEQEVKLRLALQSDALTDVDSDELQKRPCPINQEILQHFIH